MIIKFKKLNPDAILPTRAHPTDSGMDVYAAEDKVVMPGNNVVVPTGLAAEPPPGWWLQVSPRSGLAARDAVIACIGIVDNAYRGGIGVNLFNFGHFPLNVRKGDRIAQLVPMKIEKYEIVEADELTETDRGASGFGSTGK